MGMCFFFGGLNRVEQFFNITVAQTASSLLFLAVSCLIIPTAFKQFASGSDDVNNAKITALSRGVSILLLIVYGCYLFFQLKTHVSMYSAPSEKGERRHAKVQEGDMTAGIAQMGVGLSASAGRNTVKDGTALVKPEEEKEEPNLSLWVAMFTLAASTALVGICAEFLVDSINEVVLTTGISKTFVGLILLPIVGNAAEHATAVTVACKDKMDLAIGVAVGSSVSCSVSVWIQPRIANDIYVRIVANSSTRSSLHCGSRLDHGQKWRTCYIYYSLDPTHESRS